MHVYSDKIDGLHCSRVSRITRAPHGNFFSHMATRMRTRVLGGKFSSRIAMCCLRDGTTTATLAARTLSPPPCLTCHFCGNRCTKSKKKEALDRGREMLHARRIRPWTHATKRWVSHHRIARPIRSHRTVRRSTAPDAMAVFDAILQGLKLMICMAPMLVDMPTSLWATSVSTMIGRESW